MKDPVIQKLLTVNREFYQTFADNFSATRMKLQPGVLKIASHLPRKSNILDVGCGNGELACWLADKGHTGGYLGLDFSADLLEIAQTSLNSTKQVLIKSMDRGNGFDASSFTFHQVDLTTPSWDLMAHEYIKATLNTNRFDFVFAFATLHHLPGEELRIQTIKKIHSLLENDGYFIHSNWQFFNSERLRKRIQPWESVNLNLEDVEAGDYLMDWRQGGYGLRYVHHFSENELYELASNTGFEVVKSFFSDGKEGKLALYQCWEKNFNSNRAM